MQTNGMLTENDGSASPQSPPDVPQRPPRSSTVYQTTGPDARSGPVLAPTGSGSPALNPRSCVTCRRRKVRCDKQMPCSNCRRALIPCVFPAPGRAPRQQRPRDSQASPRTSSQRELALVKRLHKLEGLVDVLNTRLKVHEPAVAEPDKTADARISPVSSGPRRIEAVEVKDSTGERDIHLSLGHLVLDDQRGTSRYASSDFWSKLEDEVRESLHGSLEYS